VYRLFGAAWTTGRLSGRPAGIVLAVIAGIVPLAAALWLAMFSEDKLIGVVLVAVWLVAYLPLAVALTSYMERYGVLEEMRRRRRPRS
jgi:predicted permease